MFSEMLCYFVHMQVYKTDGIVLYSWNIAECDVKPQPTNQLMAFLNQKFTKDSCEKNRQLIVEWLYFSCEHRVRR